MLSWAPEAIEYEADRRHAEQIMQEMWIDEGSNGVVSPCVREWTEKDEEEKLSAEEASAYRRTAARANYIAPDRPDLQFAVKEACRGMSSPGMADEMRMKRIARYFKIIPAGTLEIDRNSGNLNSKLEVFVDSD